MTTETTQSWQVWMGYRASIWSHRGYTVRGETVYTDSRADAVRLVRESLDEPVAVRCDEATYYYATQEDADRDESGANAAAVVSRAEEE